MITEFHRGPANDYAVAWMLGEYTRNIVSTDHKHKFQITGGWGGRRWRSLVRTIQNYHLQQSNSKAGRTLERLVFGLINSKQIPVIVHKWNISSMHHAPLISPCHLCQVDVLPAEIMEQDMMIWQPNSKREGRRYFPFALFPTSF